MTSYTTDPGAKGRFIRALCDLADYLDQNMTIPVPAHGATILLHASSADDGGRPRSTASPSSSAPTSTTTPPTAATTGPLAPSAPSATRSSPSPRPTRPPTTR